LKLDGTKILFGGKKLTDHSIPAVYGAYNPTAIKVAIKHFKSNKNRKLLLTELFGPF
jgi:1-pyrroline-5-carboxylate dehydrogenase